MQHSIRIDSFGVEDERFFGSYEAEQIYGGPTLTPEFDDAEPQPPTPEQLAHFTRFRRPVAWVMAAMCSLSLVGLVAFGQHGSQQNSRRGVVAHSGSGTTGAASAAANKLAAVSAVPGRSFFASAAERTAEAPWSWSELAEGAIALLVEPTPPSSSAGKLSLRADSATQASLVNDFTSALLTMCRNAPS